MSTYRNLKGKKKNNNEHITNYSLLITNAIIHNKNRPIELYLTNNV